jgi:N6-adenosine-specific RNA methylase IME4
VPQGWSDRNDCRTCSGHRRQCAASNDAAAFEAINVPAAKDCVLFLWATAAMLLEALDVMRCWGLTYRTHAVWDKLGAGDRLLVSQ